MERAGGWEGSDVVVVGFVHCHVPHACDAADALTTETRRRAGTGAGATVRLDAGHGPCEQVGAS
jgi:hypothetical protein